MAIALTCLLAIVAGVVTAYRHGFALTPDGVAYLDAANGKPVPRPYSLRWFLPRLLGTERERWAWTTRAALVVSAGLVAAWVGGDARQMLTAAWLFVWLPGVFAVNVRFPVLVDAPAFAFALGAALMVRSGNYAGAVLLSLLAGASKESAPLFAAALCLNPLPLVGLLAPAWLRKSRPPTAAEPWLSRPWSYAQAHRDLLDWRRMLLPWGALAALAPMGAAWDSATLAAGFMLALGYTQLLRSTDDSRLYQLAAPAVIVLACRVDSWAVAPLLTIHPFVCGAHKGT